jgi:Nickel responsive protein SCO4226-like
MEIQVTTFLVLRQLPGVTRDQYVAAQRAVAEAVDQSRVGGHMVQYLGGYFIPRAGRTMCIFVADSLADIMAVNERAGVPFTEVLEAIALRPGET